MISTVIVGAGPGGSSTAKAILDRDPDHDVTIIDRHAEPWSKIQCAGGLNVPLLNDMNMKIPNDIITSEVESVILHSPNESLELNGKSIGKHILGLTVDRAAFDKWLLDDAIDAGANVSLATQAKSMDISTQGGERHINLKLSDKSVLPTDYLIGADGANSFIGRWSGIQNGTKEMHVGYQEIWEMPDYPQETMMIWFNTKWAPEGYCWAFPDGNGKVRMGLGIPAGHGNLRNHFNKFAADCDDLFKEFGRVPGVRTNRIGGLISTEAPLKSCVNDFGNIALVGCAGNHTSALTGGGILHSIIAGKALGETIGKGEPLKKYDKRWKSQLGRRLKMHYKLKGMICSYENRDFDRLCSAMSDFEMDSTNVDRQFLRFIKHVMGKDPTLIPSVVKSLIKQ